MCGLSRSISSSAHRMWRVASLGMGFRVRVGRQRQFRRHGSAGPPQVPNRRGSFSFLRFRIVAPLHCADPMPPVLHRPIAAASLLAAAVTLAHAATAPAKPRAKGKPAVQAAPAKPMLPANVVEAGKAIDPAQLEAHVRYLADDAL